MTSNARSGAALIAGSVASLVTMGLHPTGRDVFAGGAGAAHQVYLLIAVHALAIAAMPVMFFGALGLTRHLSGEHGLATAALIVFGFAAVAAMGDATADGLITPGLIAQLAEGPEAARDTVHAILAYNGLVVKALANVYIAASAVALGLWSAAMLTGRTFSRGLGIFGCIAGSVVLAGLLAGLLRPDKHGMGLVVLVESAWLISVGVKLSRAEPARATPLRTAPALILLAATLVPAAVDAQHVVQMAAPSGLFAPKRTGAPMVLVTNRLATRLRLPVATGPEGIQLQSPDGHAVSLLHIDSLCIGGLALHDLAVSGAPEFIPGG